MKRLINENTENETNDDSSDVRHRARITAQQQQHLEELKKLQESFEEKSKSEASGANIDVSENDDIAADQKAEQLKLERRVEVSRKKGILRIIAEGFSLSVGKTAWNKIISGLRGLFGEKSVAELLLQIKAGNKLIKSLLGLLRNKEKLALQVRIAALLRELKLSENASRSALNRVLFIQSQLISNLSSVTKESLGKDAKALLGYQHQALHQFRFLATQVIKKVDVSHTATQSQSQSRVYPLDISPTRPLFPQYYNLNEHASYTPVTDVRHVKSIDILAIIKNIVREVKSKISEYFKGVGETTNVFIHSHSHRAATASGIDPFSTRNTSHRQHVHDGHSHSHGSGCACCSSVLQTQQYLSFAYTPSASKLGGPSDLMSGVQCYPVAAQGVQIQL
ncbi:hypothetical protein NHE_0919 [Neorickettsia helminthoeca str. Oregon]|uniref:Uncharacterized protein n=1 Tax=Neorickettsia helminthoeca str. Oregon TaxID=1286528 RepID=X5H570_9RICK|nr:hypothetical protein [Neorickettsia helminthoeca]AHX11838.1 hypothetical protein NHE_0919 [Neorickettsia helminthoeca str. Oregon]